MGIEKRQQERVFVSLGVVLDFSSGAREARISDISMGGCFVDSIANVVENEKINLNLNLSSTETVKFNGEVAYVYPGVGFGVRFIRLTDAEKSVLKQIILAHGGKVSEVSDSALEGETEGEKEIKSQEEIMEETKKDSFYDLMRSIQDSLDDESKK